MSMINTTIHAVKAVSISKWHTLEGGTRTADIVIIYNPGRRAHRETITITVFADEGDTCPFMVHPDMPIEGPSSPLAI